VVHNNYYVDKRNGFHNVLKGMSAVETVRNKEKILFPPSLQPSRERQWVEIRNGAAGLATSWRSQPSNGQL
jgi:hypothetical protein